MQISLFEEINISLININSLLNVYDMLSIPTNITLSSILDI